MTLAGTAAPGISNELVAKLVAWRHPVFSAHVDDRIAARTSKRLGRNFEAMDPLDWLARMSDHIPGRGQHRTLFYGEYANRVRGERQPLRPTPPAQCRIEVAYRLSFRLARPALRAR